MLGVPRIKPQVLGEHAACAALLLLLPLFVLRPAVFGGQFPLDTDGIFYQIPWEEARPDHLPAEDPGGPRDVIERYYPEFAFLNRAALAGEPTQWNPLPGFGEPHLAQWRTRALSPFSIPFYWFDLRVALTLSLLAKLVVAGWAAFVAARVLWLRPASALLIGVAYQLSPVFLLTPLAPIADTAAWFPIMLIVFERFGAGRTRVWPACATVLALMLLGGDPETVAAVLVFGTISVFIRTAVSGRSVRHAVTPVMVLFISAFAGMVMTFAQLLPFAEWLRHVEPAAAKAGAQAFHVYDFVRFALPRWYGAPDLSTVGGVEAERLMTSGYVFLSPPLLLAFPLWFAVRRELKDDRTPLPDTLCAMAAVLLVAGVVIGSVGGLNVWFLRVTAAHCWFPLSLFAAALLARTGEEWSRLTPDPCQDALKRFVYMLPAIPALWAVLVLSSGPNLSDASRAIQVVFVVVAAIAFIALVFGTTARPHVAGFAYANALLVGLCSLYAYGGALPYRSADVVFPETDTVRAFMGSPDRVGGGVIAADWPLTAHGIAFARLGSGRTLQRQRTFEDAMKNDAALLPRTGLRHLALRDTDLEGEFAPVRDQMRVERSFSAGAFWMELINPVPRARLIYAAQSVPMGSETPIVSHAPPVVEGGPPLLEEPPSRGASLDVYPAIGNRYAFDVDAAAPGVLVIAEAWYPGWRAFVDGNETVVTPVDAMFRGVPVPPGAHRVELAFDPQPYSIGFRIGTLATLVILIAFVGRAWTAIRKRRKLR